MATKKKSNPVSKRSVVVHKSAKPTTDLIQLLGKTEETIQELTRMLLESEDGKHRGIRGKTKMTSKQEAILNQLDLAHQRFEMILGMLRS